MNKAQERPDFRTTDRLQLTLHHQRYEFVLAQFGRVDSALEIGTGVGIFSPLLAARCKEYKGIEIDPESAALAAKRCGPAGRVVQGDARDLPFEPRSFAVIVCLEVIEHLGDWIAGVRGIQKCLREDGLAVVSVPHRERGGKSLTNPYHIYEPGEGEFVACLKSRFDEVSVQYQYFEETPLMRLARRLHLRRVLSLEHPYRALAAGEPEAISRLKIGSKSCGMNIHLLAVLGHPRPISPTA
jgi:SAM-dependent methyltransferase